MSATLILFSGTEMIGKLLKMQMFEDDDELAYTPSDDSANKRQADGRPAWMRTLHASVSTWLKLIPKVTEQYAAILKKRCVKSGVVSM